MSNERWAAATAFCFHGHFLVENAQRREVVFHVLEGLKDGIAVGRGLGFVLLPGLVGECAALAGIEKQLRGLRAQRPERTGALEPGSAMGAFESAGAAEADGGVIRCDRDADTRIGGRGLPLG